LELGERTNLLRKTVSGIMLTLLLISMLTLAFNIQPVKASGTIYIRDDGSIDPPDSPIERIGDLYTLTGNIISSTDGIVIERDDMILDGAGFAVQGPRTVSIGLNLVGRNNVTIKNAEISGFDPAIRLDSSNCTSISGNNLTNNIWGIDQWNSFNNTISLNNIRNVGWIRPEAWGFGIALEFSSGTTVFRNNITNAEWGIWIWSGSNNIFSENNITSNSRYGIELDWTYGNIFSENNITSNNCGILLDWSSYYNIFSENNITSNNCGIALKHSSNYNSIYHNFISNIEQVSTDSISIWDDGYPSGGNYWRDYTGIDQFSGPYQNVTGSDGIGDAPYVIDANNQDCYPLMKPWTLTRTFEKTLKVGGKKYLILIETNATLTEIKVNPVNLRFRSIGVPGQMYFINVTLPAINQTEIKVFIDGVKLTPPPFPIITSNGTHYFIYFEFIASTHNITIQYATTNIATTNITPSKTIVGTGYTTSINVTVENQGIYTETFNVTVYAKTIVGQGYCINITSLVRNQWSTDRSINITAHANTTIIGTFTNITLSGGSSTTFTFTWNTTGIAKGNYTIWAYAWPVSGETDTADNTLDADKEVRVTIPGDVDGDYWVFLYDAVKLLVRYGAKEGQSQYDPVYDIDNDGRIFLYDAVILLAHYGQKDP
jgi:parallel beta-helix repeat protein